jgi:hypothetical protein
MSLVAAGSDLIAACLPASRTAEYGVGPPRVMDAAGAERTNRIRRSRSGNPDVLAA